MSFELPKIAILGTGYVGLTTGVTLAYLGNDVICVDTDKEKISKLRKGRSPIHEPHLEPLLQNERLDFSTESDRVAGADIIMVCVGTPSADDGQANLSYLELATQGIAETLQPDREYVVVVKSTVPVGTTDRVKFLLQETLKQRQVKTTVYVASNPEFLREGVALYDMFYPDRIVVGVGQQKASDLLWRLYRPLLEQSFDPPQGLERPDAFPPPAFVVVDPISSELTKYAANAFLATKISFINEIAGLCEKVGADVREVARGIGLDKRIGSGFLQAGIGWGGSCFGKDTLSLIATAAEYHYPMTLLKATRTVNRAQRQWVIAKLQETLKTLRGRTVGVLGLAFKANTDDVRDAPSLDIIRKLLASGVNVQVHDPEAVANTRDVLENSAVRFLDHPEDVFCGAHAVLLLTEWKQYRSIPFASVIHKMENPLIVDGRNYLDAKQLVQHGYRVIGVGHSCVSS